jgi:hypothetical protein
MNERISQILCIAVIGAVALVASGLALEPPRNVRTERIWSPLLVGADIEAGTLRILERSCEDCHSERTHWPWYSRIPPASSLVRSDVKRARARLNLSRWQEYSPDERRALLGGIGAAARTGAMPPTRYILLHPASRLSLSEREQVYRWTRAERSHVAGWFPFVSQMRPHSGPRFARPLLAP